MTEAVRKAFQEFLDVILVEGQKIADKKVEAALNIERAASKSRIDEMAAANAVQAIEILDLRRQLADHAIKENATRENALLVGRQLAAVTERASRAESLVENMAAQIKYWKHRWETMRSLFAESGAEQLDQSVQCERLDISPTESERGTPPVFTAKGVCTEGGNRCQRQGPDCLEAAIVFLRSAARCRRHQYSSGGENNGPLNELRGSKSNDVAELGLS